MPAEEGGDKNVRSNPGSAAGRRQPSRQLPGRVADHPKDQQDAQACKESRNLIAKERGGHHTNGQESRRRAGTIPGSRKHQALVDPRLDNLVENNGEEPGDQKQGQNEKNTSQPFSNHDFPITNRGSEQDFQGARSFALRPAMRIVIAGIVKSSSVTSGPMTIWMVGAYC